MSEFVFEFKSQFSNLPTVLQAIIVGHKEDLDKHYEILMKQKEEMKSLAMHVSKDRKSQKNILMFFVDNSSILDQEEYMELIEEILDEIAA